VPSPLQTAVAEAAISLAEVPEGAPITMSSSSYSPQTGATTGSQGVKASPMLQPSSLPSPTVPLPISPKVLAASLIAADEPGIAAILFIRQAVTVPAGGSAQITIPVAAGNVMIITAPIRVFSDSYTSELTATLIVDQVNVLLNDFPMTAEAEEVMPEYGVIRNSIVATLQNGTPSSIEVTYDAEVVLLTQDYYNQVVSPFMRYGAQTIQSLTSTLLEGGVVV
jgi:hypothetical protein